VDAKPKGNPLERRSLGREGFEIRKALQRQKVKAKARGGTGKPEETKKRRKIGQEEKNIPIGGGKQERNW